MNRIAGVMLVLAFALASASHVPAQDRDSQLRTVRGQVLSKDDNSISGAVVYLRGYARVESADSPLSLSRSHAERL